MVAPPAAGRGYVDTPGGQVHFMASGSGAPLVLLHMTSDAASQWTSVLPVFGARGLRAVALDIPGHGASYTPDFKPGGPDNARMVIEALDGLGIDRFHLLGRHFGATVAAWIALRYPQRVRTVTFNGYPMVNEKWRHRLAADEPRPYRRGGDEIRRYWATRWRMSDMGRPQGSPTGFTEAQALRTFIAKLQAGPNWHYAHHTVAATDHAQMARSIETPVLVLTGPRDYFFEENRAAASLFHDGRFLELPDGGVDAIDELTDLFCDAVVAFIKEKGS